MKISQNIMLTGSLGYADVKHCSNWKISNPFKLSQPIPKLLSQSAQPYNPSFKNAVRSLRNNLLQVGGASR